MKISNIISIVLAVIIVGVVYSIDFRINTAAERRLQRIEARLDSVTATVERQQRKHATWRFVLDNNDTVYGAWADMQAQVWRIRAAEPTNMENNK